MAGSPPRCKASSNPIHPLTLAFEQKPFEMVWTSSSPSANDAWYHRFLSSRMALPLNNLRKVISYETDKRSLNQPYCSDNLVAKKLRVTKHQWESSSNLDLFMTIRRCPWCNGYCHRIWTRRYEFNSWTRLIAFHIALIPLGKVWIQLFSLQLWINSRAD